ncbi:MAG: acetyl-CoA carboxylase biotin carboxyl carrier protein [Clostridia bacterium]|nr:acetyl-CoA carboxylase biotin carboxyl carrier protein [Clostridia bacterium]
MEYKEIKKLMEDMGNSKLSELEIEFSDGIKISMKKDNGSKSSNNYNPSNIQMPVSMPTPIVPITTNVNSNNVVQKENKESDGNIVKSPMVGTFYSKSSPTAEPYVKIGSKVKKGDILCIVEAMKLMNEIESEFEGEVVDILVHDEEMVDYGKPMFIIK